jgi:hypothetical protein
MLVDGVLHQRQEAGLPLLQPAAEEEPRLLGRDPRAEEWRKRSQEPHPDGEVGEGGEGGIAEGQRGPQYLSASRSRRGKALTTEGGATGVSAWR